MTIQFVALDHLNVVVEKALTNLSIDKQERDIIRQVLMYAEMRGSSQGLIKIKERSILPEKDCTDIELENKTPSIARINGGGHTGMFILHQATLAAVSCVKATGIAIVSTHNTRSSTGAIGFYATKLAQWGYIAMVLTSSPKVMAIEGGIDPVVGTNPIALAIPTNNEPLVLDMATAATTWFAVINARDQSRNLATNTAIDANGQPTINPHDAMKGALKTFGGAKGSGLALMFEFLTSVLGHTSLFGNAEDNRSNTIIAIDPEAIESGFSNRASDLIQRLKASRQNQVNGEGESSFRLPGERSNARAAQCLSSNRISIDAGLYKHLTELAQ